MSENLNIKELPHQFLLRKYSLNQEVLSADGKELLKQLNNTIRLVASKSKDGNVKLTPATQQKISTLDRCICDQIFDYLDDQEKISEAQIDKVEEQMDEKREEIEEKMDEIHQDEIEAKEQEQENISPQPHEAQEEHAEAPTTESTEEAENPPNHADGEEEQKKDDVKIGFWDWD